MSHIFDALQRSEAERAKADRSGSLAATELLERAERQAVSEWKSRPTVEQTESTDLPEGDPLFAPQAPLPEALAPNSVAPTSAVKTEDGRGVFAQFQTRKVSLPHHTRLVSLTESDTPAAEAFRLLGVRLSHLRRERPLKSLLITSTVPQEGKSLVAANLACTLASATQQTVLLLEGDVRRPSIARNFGLAPTYGLCTCLQGERSLAECIYHLEGPGIWILPAGSAATSPLELIQSAQLPVLMRQLGSWFDWIVIDSPPVLPLADTSVWTRLADGILLVARQGTTKKRKLQRGIEALDPNKLVGTVMNSSTASNSHDYYYRNPTPDPPPPGNSGS
jgi:capsular exopolysaccharide synthesis family protein